MLLSFVHIATMQSCTAELCPIIQLFSVDFFSVMSIMYQVSASLLAGFANHVVRSCQVPLSSARLAAEFC